MKTLLALLLLALPLQAQTLIFGTQAEQYALYPATGDSVIQLMTLRAHDMSLFDWEIVLQFDTLRTGVNAKTVANPTYLTAKITVDLATLQDMGHWLRDEIVVHELAHIMSWELVEMMMWVGHDNVTVRPLLVRANEQLVTRIARMYIWRRHGGR